MSSSVSSFEEVSVSELNSFTGVFSFNKTGDNTFGFGEFTGGGGSVGDKSCLVLIRGCLVLASLVLIYDIDEFGLLF